MDYYKTLIHHQEAAKNNEDGKKLVYLNKAERVKIVRNTYQLCGISVRQNKHWAPAN
ncbi:7606_t:CDS:2 [Dentiscutata erythropus]|uniref:7606_t:CDS:1 n=1 Tax=Dentiscutata erythropus TaxID=1348616 RepID=A0A9N9IAV2_9GLOM|nr:7606_t:CDS:2 [Dentiscutata erythropus]